MKDRSIKHCQNPTLLMFCTLLLDRRHCDVWALGFKEGLHQGHCKKRSRKKRNNIQEALIARQTKGFTFRKWKLQRYLHNILTMAQKNSWKYLSSSKHDATLSICLNQWIKCSTRFSLENAWPHFASRGQQTQKWENTAMEALVWLLSANHTHFSVRSSFLASEQPHSKQLTLARISK